MEEAYDFLREHPEFELYCGQVACEENTMRSTDEVSPAAVFDDSPFGADPLVPCVTRITVRIRFGDEEVLLSTNSMCYPLAH